MSNSEMGKRRRYSMSRFYAPVGVLLMLAGGSTALASDGYFSVGYGVKAQGMGGVGIAFPQDALIAATNPAGMALVQDRADIGLTAFAQKHNAQTSDHTFAGADGAFDGNGHGNSLTPELGFVKKVSPATTVGVAFFGNNTMSTRYIRDLGNLNSANIPYFFLGGNDSVSYKLQQSFVSPSVAYRLNDEHMLGLALNVAHQRFSARGLNTSVMTAFSVSTPGFPLSTQSGVDTSTGWGIRLGWMGQVTPDLMLGATWASKIRSGNLTNNSGLFASGASFDIPENYGVGFAYRVAPQWMLAADVSQIKYGDVNQPTGPVSSVDPLSWPNGPGFGWNDVTVVKLGLCYDYSQDLTLRAGYNRAGQAIPADRTYFNMLAAATVRDHLTIGFTLRTFAGGELSAAYVHGFKAALSGSSTLPTGIPNYPHVIDTSISTAERSLGLAYGWKF